MLINQNKSLTGIGKKALSAAMNTIFRTPALLKPADLFPAWKWIDIMEECGEMDTDEGQLWKEGIYGLMVLWGMEAGEVLR
jgi:hypothetical protein